MNNSAVTQPNSSWSQNGARFAGIFIAGRCIIFLLFLGFGLLIMGTISISTSSSFDDFQGKGTNPPRTAGICMLSIGGVAVFFGAILTLVAKAQLEKLRTENRAFVNNVAVLPPAPVVSGTPYQSGYPPQPSGGFPTQTAGNYQQYPPQVVGHYLPQANPHYSPEQDTQYFADKQTELRPPPYSP